MSDHTIPMPRSEEGQLELVLGNKQLLTIFFLVVVLVSVFFMVGYVIGRNSSPVEQTAKSTYTREAAPSAVPAPAKKEAAPVVTEAAPAVQAPATSEPVPAVDDPKAAPPKPLEVAPVSSAVVQPQAGQTYIQVIAVARPEAEVLVEILTKRGFKALVAPGPDAKTFRVLVGPAKDAADVGKLKGDLEQAGFKGAFQRPY